MHKKLERTTTDGRNLNYIQGLPSSNTLEKTTIKWKSTRLQRTDSSYNRLFQNMYVESHLITERRQVAALEKGQWTLQRQYVCTPLLLLEQRTTSLAASKQHKSIAL